MPLSDRRNARRFIPGEHIARAERWQFGAIGTLAEPAPARREPQGEAAIAAHVEAVRELAWHSGYDEGLAAGRAQAGEQIQVHLTAAAKDNRERADAVLRRLTDEVDGRRQQVAGSLVELACDIARQVLRRELATDPQLVRSVVDEAIALVAADNQPRLVRLHPQDLALLQPEGGAAAEGAAVQVPLEWRADPSIQPGGCIVEAGSSTVDATLDKRWRQVVAKLGLTGGLDEDAMQEPDHGAE